MPTIAPVPTPPPPSDADAIGVSAAYEGEVFENITGPVSAGCRTQPSKRSVR
jgi:hypothetical protein